MIEKVVFLDTRGSLPFTKVALPGGNMDAENRQARWGTDDVWRIVWMTIIFGALMPLSRSAWALKKNFTLSMCLHMVRRSRCPRSTSVIKAPCV